MTGWMGTILRVDLSRNKVTKEPLSEELAHNYIGGRGINARVLYSELKPGVDPLGSDNKLLVGAGPCNGTLVPCSQRFTVSAKSPQTGFIGDSNCGGSLGAMLKYAGYDMIIIEGAASSPAYLWIDDDKVELRSAEYLWGKTVKETKRGLESELGDPNISTICIGPAGENLVKFANIIAGMGRAAGRAGLGAVMGSKKLKAVAVRGSHGVKVTDPELLKTTAMEFLDKWRSHPKAYEVRTNLGAAGTWAYRYNEYGMATTRNFQSGILETDYGFPSALVDERFVKPKACFSCPVSCDHLYVAIKGPHAGTFGEALESEQTGAYLAQIDVKDLDIMLAASALTDDLGMDIMDTSGILSFAMECYDREILAADDLGGIPLAWGNGEGALKLIEMIAHREGIGNLFAEGLRKSAQAIGKGSEKYAIEVKGAGMSIRDPRGSKSYALAYAVSSRGADHAHAMPEDTAVPFADASIDARRKGKAENPLCEEGKAEMVKRGEDMRAVQSSLEMCAFCDFNYRDPDVVAMTRFLKAVTGFDMTADDMRRVGERIINLERAFNVREGLSRKDDTLPRRFLKEPMPDGPAKGQVVDLKVMLDRYYELRGYDQNSGAPTEKKLIELGLEDVAQELKAMAKLRME